MESPVEIPEIDQHGANIDDDVRRQKRREVEPAKQHDAEQQRGTEMERRKRHTVVATRPVEIRVVANQKGSRRTGQPTVPMGPSVVATTNRQ